MNQYTEMDDATLVRLTLLGKDEAFAELVRRYESAVKKSAYRITGNTFSAEDASQDAFVAAWTRLDTLGDYARFSPWICRIAANRAKNLMIKYRRDIPDISLDLDEYADLAESDDAELLDLISLRAGEVQDEKLAAALAALSEKVREVVRLHYFDELSVDEIARRLFLPTGTVKWRLSEGRRKLRKEYGIMEKSYDENESLVHRVMYAVEQLKLWRLQKDKTGFEDEYRSVLALVSELDDGEQKSHAAADVLLMGYWWIDSEKNDEVLRRIKKEAEIGHNDEVMRTVVMIDAGKMFLPEEMNEGLPEKWIEEKIAETKNETVPYLKKHGFKKALGSILRQLATCLSEDHDECIAILREALEALPEDDNEYYLVKDSIDAYERRFGYNGPSACLTVLSYDLRKIDGKWWYWDTRGQSFFLGDSTAIFYSVNTNVIFAVRNNTLFDPDKKPGYRSEEPSVVGSVFSVEDAPVTVTTPAGTFENCLVYRYESNNNDLHYHNVSRRFFCHGVGVVRYENEGTHSDYNAVWELASYTANGDDPFPIADGNRWEYVCSYTDPDKGIQKFKNVFRIEHAEGNKAILVQNVECEFLGFPETWRRYMLDSREKVYNHDFKKGYNHFNEAKEVFDRAEELASTPRELMHTKAARKMAKLLQDSDPHEDRLLVNYWSIFNRLGLRREGARITLDYSEVNDYILGEIRNPIGREGYIMVSNYLYEVINTLTGAVWSDEWVPGYDGTVHVDHWGESADNTVTVSEAGTVGTPAGTFGNCICVKIDSGIHAFIDYMFGVKEYYYAPGVGLIRYVTYYGEEPIEFVLTEYQGEGEGYFPLTDGAFRRMEVFGLRDDCHVWVEMTYSVEGDDAVVFVNQCATQDKDSPDPVNLAQ